MFTFPTTFMSSAVISALFGPPDFTSTQFTPALGALTSQAHSLGGRPTFVVAELVCLIANNNYSVGDRIFWNIYGTDNAGTQVISPGLNATDIFVTVPSGAFKVPDKSTSAPVLANNTNWALEMLAWKDNIPEPAFASSDFGTPAGSTKYSAAHSLGSLPKLIIAEMECLIAEENYAVGDVIYNFTLNMSAGNSNAVERGNQIGYNATDVFSLISSANFVDKNTGDNAGQPTSPNWSYILKAWDLPAPDFESSLITPVSGAKISEAHGLSQVDFLMGELVCNTGEENWVAGDTMPFNELLFDAVSSSTSDQYGYVAGYDSSDAFAITGVDGMRLLDRNTPDQLAGAALTNANWDYRLRAWGTVAVGDGSMHDIVPSCVCDIDATIIASYSGSGETISNIVTNPDDSETQAAYDFWNGLTGAVDGDELTFVGTAGVSGAYFEHTGSSVMKIKSNTALLNDFHKNSGGAPITFAKAFRTAPTLSNRALFGTMIEASGSGFFVWMIQTGSKIRIVQGGAQNITETSITVNADTDYVMIISLDFEGTGDMTIWLNSDTGTTISMNIGSESGAPGKDLELGSSTAGFESDDEERLYGQSIFNEYFDNTKAAAVRAQYVSRHGF